jgi:hypothetical protein
VADPISHSENAIGDHRDISDHIFPLPRRDLRSPQYMRWAAMIYMFESNLNGDGSRERCDICFVRRKQNKGVGQF